MKFSELSEASPMDFHEEGAPKISKGRVDFTTPLDPPLNGTLLSYCLSPMFSTLRISNDQVFVLLTTVEF